MAGGPAGSGEVGEPRSEAGHQGRGLEGEEGGEVDTREVVTRPREEHFVFDLAGNLRGKRNCRIRVPPGQFSVFKPTSSLLTGTR